MASGKVIIVVTNASKLGNTDNKTGWYLPEVAHPYEVFTKAGFDVVFVSPKGGKAPMDEGSGVAFQKDPICQQFLKEHVSKLDSTVQSKDIKPNEYKGLFYAGGHGPMFDLPKAEDVATLAATMYKNGKILGAVCHGTVGFTAVRIKGADGTEQPLVKGQTVTSFTNDEEDAVSLSKEMPFMLETRLKEQGANFVGAENWACNVQVSGQLVSGQNPASATKTAEEMVILMKK